MPNGPAQYALFPSPKRPFMQTANLLTAAPIAAPGQAPGVGLVSAGFAGGLFGSADAQGGESSGPSGFPEALMAALLAGQPQPLPTNGAPPEGETPPAVAGASAPSNGALLSTSNAPVAPATDVASEVVASATAAETPDESLVQGIAQPTADALADNPVPAARQGEGKGEAKAPLAAAAALKDAVSAVGRDIPAAPTVQAATATSALVQVALLEAAPAEPQAPAETTAPPPAAVQQAVASAEAQKTLPPARAEASKPSPRDRAQPVVGQSVTLENPLAEIAVAAKGDAQESSFAEKLSTRPEEPADDAVTLTDAAEPAANPLPPITARAAEASPVLAEGTKVNGQTVAHLSAQIAKGAEAGRSTRFDLQLEPLGLGKVDVRVEINRAGDIVADLRFDNPMAAADLKSRSGELAAALENAGFDPAKTQLSFSSGGQQNFAGQFGQDLWSQQQGQGRQGFSGRSFTDLADLADSTVAPSARLGRTGGVDVRI